jgi:hypothetical protein
MLRVLVGVVLLMSGCAFDPPTERVSVVRPKTITKSEFKTRACTITTAPMSKEEFCAPTNKKTCQQIETCGEAYYRYTTCGDLSLDAVPLGSKVPPPEGQPNGVPCEQRLASGRAGCGKDGLAMAAKIRAEPPFSPPPKVTKVCDPA